MNCDHFLIFIHGFFFNVIQFYLVQSNTKINIRIRQHNLTEVFIVQLTIIQISWRTKN